MRILVACEFSGIVRDAFAAKGWDAWSCDLLPSEKTGNHIQGDVLGVLNDGWDLMIAHPPCTYLCNSGVRHLHSHVVSRTGKKASIGGEKRWEYMRKAACFFRRFMDSGIPRIAIENPIPHKYSKEIIGKYSQIIQPWQFGHGEVKAICLWLKNLPKLTPTRIVDGRVARCHRMGPGPNRWKERSRTFPGIAEAMAEQWTRAICSEVDSEEFKEYGSSMNFSTEARKESKGARIGFFFNAVNQGCFVL